MHILDCQSPQRIFNKYTKEFQYVPCGKCPACLRSRANRWIERLNVERKCWKYCLFYTLTYSEENVPLLEKLDDNYLIDLTHVHQSDKDDVALINLSEVYKKCTPEEELKLRNYISKNDKFTYLSVYDSQLFIKRLRKNLKNVIKKAFPYANEKDYQVRYYHIGEYGSTTKRAHYHGLLFFSSDKEAACIEQVVRQSWKFGIVDSSFVSDSNASYLAKYLNCTADLPKIYEQRTIRPFALFSKCPPLGTLYFNEEKVQEIFCLASPTVLVDYFNTLSPSHAWMWRTYQDRLFPKLTGFSNLSHFDRVKLYRACVYFTEKFGENVSSADFAHFMLGHYNAGSEPLLSEHYLQAYHDYIKVLHRPEVDLLASIMRWYAISKRVCTQAAAFDVSIERYVTQIEKYFSNVELEKLSSMYDFQSMYANSYGSESLIGMDKEFFESILDIPLDLLSAEEILTLQGYGIDVKRFTSEDLSERLRYQSELIPENTRDYLNLTIDSASWLKKHQKTKVKNDYLAAHPELQYRLSDLI